MGAQSIEPNISGSALFLSAVSFALRLILFSSELCELRVSAVNRFLLALPSTTVALLLAIDGGARLALEKKQRDAEGEN